MKKRRTKIKNLIIFVTILLLVIKSFDHYKIYEVMHLGYSFSSAKEIYNSKYYEQIKNNKYSKIIDMYITNDNFNYDNLDTYYLIDYQKVDDFLNIINTFINKKYSSEEINSIMNKYDENLYIYLKDNKVEDITNYLDIDYFKSENIERYIKYFNGNYEKTILDVNIGIDKGYYNDPNIISTYGITMIVNKYNKLSDDFEISLEKVTKCVDDTFYLSKDAKESYEIMCEESKSDNINFLIKSAYRSYEDQEEIYNYYLNTYGTTYATNYVALPGYSEHETGLALDIKSKDTTFFLSSKEYTWLINNAYKYGFILRYPKGKENITGYNSESWHFRYVGKDIAKYIYDNDITYEEYYAMNF